MQFEKWPGIPRLSKEKMIITEKLDGTNACIVMQPAPHGVGDQELTDSGIVLGMPNENAPFGVELVEFAAQSRSRFITPKDDNYGFAKWAYQNAEKLYAILGYGKHYGEWWGSGIQRNYGLPEKRFSLFNAPRWNEQISYLFATTPVAELRTVPMLYNGPADWSQVELWREKLAQGSVAAPNFKGKAEGMVVYLRELNASYKVLIENDDIHKWEVKK